MKKPIANANASFSFPGSIVSGISLKTNAGGAGVLKDGTVYSVAPFTSGTCVISTPTLVTLNGSSAKTRVEGSPVIREGDSQSFSAVGVDSGTGSPCTANETLEVSSAGQTKVVTE